MSSTFKKVPIVLSTVLALELSHRGRRRQRWRVMAKVRRIGGGVKTGRRHTQSRAITHSHTRTHTTHTHTAEAEQSGVGQLVVGSRGLPSTGKNDV